ncbi:hypothetical protein [Natrinema sp. SYSU A 869]|uniref:DUF7511 domain-containing protein n=1 Tax=Natrinema sp. SYSU A 869 TaxID=2871694 RepID=UPI001CA437A6
MATTLAWTIMDGSTHADEGTAHEYTADTDETDPAGPVLFDAIVVRYQSDSDRCTLVPRDGTTEMKLNAWLTANLETVVDLDDAR